MVLSCVFPFISSEFFLKIIALKVGQRLQKTTFQEGIQVFEDDELGVYVCFAVLDEFFVFSFKHLAYQALHQVVCVST